jgi:molybdenum cofactor synthesis domain-containing protein
MNIRLLDKKGGKSSFKDRFRRGLRARVVVCSDSISAGDKQDRAGLAIMDKLKTDGVNDVTYTVIPDEADRIAREAIVASEIGLDLLIFTGGTGLSVRDVTPEALAPLIDRQVPGIAEAIRAHGQQRTPYSMLSRCVAGVRGSTLILALPGSTRGAQESMEAVFPHVLHLYSIMRGARHD